MRNLILLLFSFLLFSACEYKLIVHNGSGSGKYDLGSGSVARIEADTPLDGMRFYKWSSENRRHLSCLKNGIFSSTNLIDRHTTFSCINSYDKKTVVELTAEYIEEDIEVYVEVFDGEGSGTYRPGDEVIIYSTHILGSEHLAFYEWEGDISSVYGFCFPEWQGPIGNNYGQCLSDFRNGRISFRVGLEDIVLRPVYKEQYKLSMDETGNGMKENSMVFVGADKIIEAVKPKVGYRFSGWVGDIKYLDDPMNMTQHFMMPRANVELTATYEEE